MPSLQYPSYWNEEEEPIFFTRRDFCSFVHQILRADNIDAKTFAALVGVSFAAYTDWFTTENDRWKRPSFDSLKRMETFLRVYFPDVLGKRPLFFIVSEDDASSPERVRTCRKRPENS